MARGDVGAAALLLAAGGVPGRGAARGCGGWRGRCGAAWRGVRARPWPRDPRRRGGLRVSRGTYGPASGGAVRARACRGPTPCTCRWWRPAAATRAPPSTSSPSSTGECGDWGRDGAAGTGLPARADPRVPQVPVQLRRGDAESHAGAQVSSEGSRGGTSRAAPAPAYRPDPLCLQAEDLAPGQHLPQQGGLGQRRRAAW